MDGCVCLSVMCAFIKGLDTVCYDLIRNLGIGGESILIFLPGIGEISELYETLANLEVPPLPLFSHTHTCLSVCLSVCRYVCSSG